MVGKVKHIIRQRNPSLEFFHEIHKLIEKRWNKLNTSLRMVAYALNPDSKVVYGKDQIEFFLLMMKR